jgi:4-hydroxybenzoate polyprenyltransferase
MRPHQYIKNFFIFLPLFFALKITNFSLLIQTIIAFISFSLTASAVYILNDLKDIKEDKLHPKKRFRPIASGKISKKIAITLMIVLLFIGFFLMMIVSFKSTEILLLYVIMNILYSLWLKHIAIIDIVIIAVGFVLRIFVGSFATDITLSAWIIVMTFLLALFMALAKRRDDVLIYENTGKKMRKVIDGYNAQFLDAAMVIMASVVIVAYITYTTSNEVIHKFHTNYLYITALFVILGILRYLQITFVELNSGSPTKIVLKDRFIQLTLLGWLITFIWILY